MGVKHKFTCNSSENDYLEIYVNDNCIQIEGECWNEPIDIILDKTTAIKLAKTLRTEINKIK